jgi:hypothetical protein
LAAAPPVASTPADYWVHEIRESGPSAGWNLEAELDGRKSATNNAGRAGRLSGRLGFGEVGRIFAGQVRFLDCASSCGFDSGLRKRGGLELEGAADDFVKIPSKQRWKEEAWKEAVTAVTGRGGS